MKRILTAAAAMLTAFALAGSESAAMRQESAFYQPEQGSTVLDAVVDSGIR